MRSREEQNERVDYSILFIFFFLSSKISQYFFRSRTHFELFVLGNALFIICDANKMQVENSIDHWFFRIEFFEVQSIWNFRDAIWIMISQWTAILSKVVTSYSANIRLFSYLHCRKIKWGLYNCDISHDLDIIPVMSDADITVVDIIILYVMDGFKLIKVNMKPGFLTSDWKT